MIRRKLVKLFLFLMNLIQFIIFSHASDRPSIFNMPGVQQPDTSESWENNPCFQKLISQDPLTGQTFAETLYAPLIQKIHEETNIPKDKIQTVYATQHPEETASEIIINLNRRYFSKCYSPENVMSKFKEKLKNKMQLTINSDTVSEIKKELFEKGYRATSGEQNSDTSLFVERDNPHSSSTAYISYIQIAPNNVYFSIKPTPYTTSHLSGFTPDNFYETNTTHHSVFTSKESRNFSFKNNELLSETRSQTLIELKNKYKGQPIAVSASDRIPFKMFASFKFMLKSAEQSNWDFSELAQENEEKSRLFNNKPFGNFSAQSFCRDRQNCGSVVIEEEAIHKAYHEYLQNKQHLTIVDLGSSIGFNSIRYTLSNNQVILCDRSLDALIEAGNYILQDHPDKAGNLYLTTESADQLTLPKNSVDVVFMGYIIKYFPGNNIDQMLSNVFKYLKPNGKLFLVEIPPTNKFYTGVEKQPFLPPITTPSQYWKNEIGAIYRGTPDIKNFQYNLTKVTEEDIINGLERAGFKIEENLTNNPDGSYNFIHMPAIQIIAVKP